MADQKPRQQRYLLFDAVDDDGRIFPTQPSKEGWNTHIYDVFVSAKLKFNGTRFRNKQSSSEKEITLCVPL